MFRSRWCRTTPRAWRSSRCAVRRSSGSGIETVRSLLAALILAGGDAVFLLEHAGEIQRFPKAAEMGDVGDALMLIATGEAFGCGLQAGIAEKAVGRDAHLPLEELAKIVIVEGQGLEIAVQLEILIRVVADDGTFNLLHHGAAVRLIQRGLDQIHDQVAVGSEERSVLVRVRTEEIKGGGKGVQQEVVLVLPEQGGLAEAEQGILQIQVDVGKAPLALVQMRGERRDDHQIASLIGQGGAVQLYSIQQNVKNDLTTGIRRQKRDEKSLIDGEIFDIQGRKRERPQNGIYILNGHKVFISTK